MHIKQLLPLWITGVVSLHIRVKQLLPLLVTTIVGGQDITVGTNCDGVWTESVAPYVGEQHRYIQFEK